MNNIKHKIKEIIKNRKSKKEEICYRKKYNTLKLNYDILKESVENGFYQEYLEKFNESVKVILLKEENQKLRNKNKELKEKLKKIESEK